MMMVFDKGNSGDCIKMMVVIKDDDGCKSK